LPGRRRDKTVAEALLSEKTRKDNLFGGECGGSEVRPKLQKLEGELLSCARDRLTLLAAGSDPCTGGPIAVAEHDRTFCGQRDPLLAARPRRGDWVSAGPEPKLRGRVARR
jgi:hypothetical protein